MLLYRRCENMFPVLCTKTSHPVSQQRSINVCSSNNLKQILSVLFTSTSASFGKLEQYFNFTESNNKSQFKGQNSSKILSHIYSSEHPNQCSRLIVSLHFSLFYNYNEIQELLWCKWCEVFRYHETGGGIKQQNG